MQVVNSLTIRDNRSFSSLIDFREDCSDYEISVPRDTFGLLIQAEYDPRYYLSITADRDAGRYLFPDIDPSMGDYSAGSEVPYYDSVNGYIIRLDKRPLSLTRSLEEQVTLTFSGALLEPVVYHIRVRREADEQIQACFRTYSYPDQEFGIDLPYELYIPTSYDPQKRYPIVIALHGTGERTEDPGSLIRTFAMATAFAKDSEEGHNECFVLAPQCVLKYDEDDNWTSVNQFVHGKSNSPFWPMPQIKIVWKILKDLESRFSIDPARRYLTGISSGAFGVFALAFLHPGEFACLAPLCGAGDPEKLSLLKGTPLWIVHAEDDPVMNPDWSLNPLLHALGEQHIPYRLTLYPKGQIFWQSGHFCWEVIYHNREFRDWFFSNRRKQPL